MIMCRAKDVQLNINQSNVKRVQKKYTKVASKIKKKK